MAKTRNPGGNKRKDETLTNNTIPENSGASPTVATPTFAAAKSEMKAEPRSEIRSEPNLPLRTNGAREGARLAVVKQESRATVMPINVEEEIRRRAYELSERRGFSWGHETEDWLVAESEVLRRYRQHSA